MRPGSAAFLTVPGVHLEPRANPAPVARAELVIVAGTSVHGTTSKGGPHGGKVGRVAPADMFRSDGSCN
jgi:hypothetical protein